MTNHWPQCIQRIVRRVPAWLRSSLVVSLVLATVACSSKDAGLQHVTFLTNYVFIGRHAPFFVGVDKGFYRDAGLDVEILPATGSSFVITALEAGRADFGIAEVAPVVQAIGKGASVKAFGVFMERSTSGLASLAPYPTLQSIDGRRVAASLTDAARIVLPILSGPDRPDGGVQWVTADPSTYASLLLSGQADLATASIDSDVPALRAIAARDGREVHFASFADWGYDVYGYFLVTRGAWIETRPELVRSFADATVKAVRYAAAHPDEAARILASHAPALSEEMARAQWGESLRAMRTAPIDDAGFGIAAREHLTRSIEFVARVFALEPRPTADDVYADGLMPR